MNPAIFIRAFPDPTGQLLGTGYNQFHAGCGVDGLAKENGQHLDVLAVSSDCPGSGQFREFVRLCKLHYDSISVWEVWNPTLARILERYDFEKDIHIEPDGEVLLGFTWKKSIDSPPAS